MRNTASGIEVRDGGHAVAWVLLVIALGIAAAGAYLGWADRWAWYDEAIHVCTFFAISLVASLYLYGGAATDHGRHTLVLVFTVVCVAVALGVAWEWGELAYDRLTGEESVIKGKFDTLLDLGMDAIGGLLAGVFMLAMLTRPAGAPGHAHGDRASAAD